MINSTISINLGSPADYAKVVGSRLSYSNSEAHLRAKENVLEISFSADDAKSLLAAMGSVMRQLTVVNNALEFAGQRINTKNSEKSRNGKKVV